MLWAGYDGASWSAHRDLDRGALSGRLDQARAEGFYPISLSAYDTATGARFAVVLRKGGTGTRWSARLALSAEEYRREDQAR